MLLLSSCAVWRCVPWPLGRRFTFYIYFFRMFIELSFFRIVIELPFVVVELLSTCRNSLGTILSYRYRTLISERSIRYPTPLYTSYLHHNIVPCELWVTWRCCSCSDVCDFSRKGLLVEVRGLPIALWRYQLHSDMYQYDIHERSETSAVDM